MSLSFSPLHIYAESLHDSAAFSPLFAHAHVLCTEQRLLGRPDDHIGWGDGHQIWDGVQ